jgi:hypothetical protein
VGECEVVEVLGEAYIALRITIEIRLNYAFDREDLPSSRGRTTDISLSISRSECFGSSTYPAEFHYPPPTGGRIARLVPSFKIVSRPCMSVMLRPSIKNCTWPFGSFDPVSSM